MAVKSLHINLARGWRGGERQTLLLVQGLRAAGETAELLARRGEPLARRAAAAGIPVHYDLAKLFSARCLGFDVIHAHEARALQWAACARVLGGPPVVATRRVDNRPREGWFTRFKYGRADRIVAISDYVREVMLGWGADPGRLSVIPSAVPEACLQPNPERVATLRASIRAERVIGFVGALVNKHKDPLTLLRAFHLLRQHDKGLALMIVGDGPDRHTLERYISEHAIEGVHLTGFVEDPENYYPCMDVFVLPSRMEGLGTAVLDAFAWGLPVVAGRAGALPEIVRDGETGLLFEPGDPDELALRLRWALDYPEACQRMVSAASDLLRERHSPEVMVAAYRALYQRLCR